MRRVLMSAVIPVAVVLAGCGATAPTAKPNEMTADEATAEYFDEAEKWELAPGWSWPSDPEFPSVGEYDWDMVYEVGYGRAQADMYWECSWSRYLLDTDDPAERERSVDELHLVTTSHLYLTAYDLESRQFADRILDQIGDGDFAEFEQVTDANCPQVSAP